MDACTGLSLWLTEPGIKPGKQIKPALSLDTGMARDVSTPLVYPSMQCKQLGPVFGSHGLPTASSIRDGQGLRGRPAVSQASTLFHFYWSWMLVCELEVSARVYLSKEGLLEMRI